MENLEVINNEVYARPNREDFEYEFNEVIRIIKNSEKLNAVKKQEYLSMLNALHESQTIILEECDFPICLTPYFIIRINHSRGIL